MSGIFPETDSRAKPVKDNKTDMTYRSRGMAGKALAIELGLDPENRLIWYEVVKLVPYGRLIDAKTGRPINSLGQVD